MLLFAAMSVTASVFSYFFYYWSIFQGHNAVMQHNDMTQTLIITSLRTEGTFFSFIFLFLDSLYKVRFESTNPLPLGCTFFI